ncbi:MAG TPA: hypothetical protein VMD49_06045 [Steroidobacteraceae bacterium]|nr:hypothetical protein [Steroidobacteraceae bacterium]
MNDRDRPPLEQRLRKALRPVEPPAGFAQSVMTALARARAAAASASTRATRGAEERRSMGTAWLATRRPWLAAAASLVLAVVLVGAGLWGSHRAQELRARDARAQVLEALRISSQTLNAALHASVDPRRSG